jgi:hypothetical protein
MLIQLPNGLIDGHDLFNFADIDELRGKQQNYLVDKELVVGNLGHIPKILKDLILSLQTKEGIVWKGNMEEAIYKLPSGDLETILIKIRENTFGPKFFHEAECTHCGNIVKNLRLDLDKLEIDYMSIKDLIEPKVVHLPKLNVDVELKPTYLKDLFEIIKIANNKADSLITSVLSLTIKRLGDNVNITSDVVGNIPATDLVFLQGKLEELKLEGSIDTDIEIDCNKCNKEFTIKLNCFDPGFFDHSRAFKS